MRTSTKTAKPILLPVQERAKAIAEQIGFVDIDRITVDGSQAKPNLRVWGEFDRSAIVKMSELLGGKPSSRYYISGSPHYVWKHSLGKTLIVGVNYGKNHHFSGVLEFQPTPIKQ